MPVAATENDVLSWLWRHFFAQSWAVVPQVTVSMTDVVGHQHPAYRTRAAEAMTTTDVVDKINNDRDRRIDMLAVRAARDPRRGPLESLAIEVKVTRADFLSDVRDPDKQAPWRAAATRHAYAVPAGLVQAHEVPTQSGLLWCTPSRFAGGMPDVKWVKRAPYRDGHAPQPPARVTAAMLYRTSRFEADVRGWNYRIDAAASIEELRAELRAVRRDRDRADTALQRALEQTAAWKRAYAMANPDGVPCGICGRPIKPRFPKGQWFRDWVHIDPADTEPCLVSEEAARVLAARVEYATALADGTLETRLRAVHRFGLNEQVEAEPWRAYLDPGRVAPYPTDGLPDANADRTRYVG